MLFYATLTVAGVIAAAVVVWLFRSLSVAGKSAYRTLSPSGRSSSQARLAHLNSGLAATPAPWGWGQGKGAPPSSKFDHHRTQAPAPSPSKSRDWSSVELYARSNEKAARERNASPAVGSVRNVLTGYDMSRPTNPDTSSWPYQDSFKGAGVAEPTQRSAEDAPLTGERPTKPWGW